MQSSSYDTDKGVAEIELVTKRTDTQAYFAKRYGKLVKPIVTGSETTVLECAPSTAFKIEPDGLSIRPRYESGGGAEYERTEVAEFPDRVEIGVVERAPTGARTLDLQHRLRAPHHAQRPARRPPRDRQADRQAAPPARSGPG